MIALHTRFGPHGNLTSSNCVVTERWVVQITDFGLSNIRCLNYKQKSYETLNEITENIKSKKMHTARNFH